MWSAIKAFFFYLVKWLGFIGVTIVALAMVYTFFSQTSGIGKKSEVQVVEEKYTHKGLYFAQQYYIKVSNGESHSVFKHDFNALEEGDSFQPFFNALSWKDFWFISILSGVVSILFFSATYFFAFLLFHQTKWFQKLEAKRKQIIAWFVSRIQKNDKTKERWKKDTFLVLIIVLSIPYVLMTKNIMVKIIPLGKESAIAEIQDHDITKSRRFKGKISDVYTLTYTFKDENNETYQTAKDVSRHTYHKYANESHIPIFYRKRFPYETFIDTQSAGEVVSTILRYSNFVFLIIASLLIYFIKKFIDTWGIPFVRKKKCI